MKRKSEIHLVSKCAVWFKNTYCLKNHSPRCQWILVPNEIVMKVRALLVSEGVRTQIINKVVGSLSQELIATGLCTGASDVIIVLPNKTIYCEFKIGDNTQQTNQIEFEQSVVGLGHEYHVIRSFEQLQSIIMPYMKDYVKTSK